MIIISLSRINTVTEGFYMAENKENTTKPVDHHKQLDEKYYNRFIYDMDVHALYATINTKLFGRLGVMAGLRGEYWKVNTESYSYQQEHHPELRDEPFKKDYFQLFPSLFLSL